MQQYVSRANRRLFYMSNYKKTSKISGFYKLPIKDRIEIVKKFSDLSEEEINILSTPINIFGEEITILFKMVWSISN